MSLIFLNYLEKHNLSDTKISDLQGLGPKSELWLNQIGIFTRSDLEAMGAVGAFIKLSEHHKKQPSLNLLYAMIGVLEDRHWATIAKNDRERLLNELQGCKDLEALFNSK